LINRLPTIVDQAEADRDIPKLLRVPAKVRFLSMEPLLGHVDVFSTMTGELLHTSGNDYNPGAIDWIVVGGESGGPLARHMHPVWPRSLRDQCAAAGVPFLMKQWGEWHTASVLSSTGEPVFRTFESFEQWGNKAPTWVNGGICLDKHGNSLETGADFMQAGDEDRFPVTVMHRVGKKAAGRLLDGVLHHEFPVTSADVSAACQRALARGSH
jgi:protein gp37